MQIIVQRFLKGMIFILVSSFSVFCIGKDKRPVDADYFQTSMKHQCTSFCLDNNNFAVFGSNYDYGKDINEGLVFVNKRNVSKSYWVSDQISEPASWTSKYGSITFNLIIQHFAWGGMNEAGLIISTMELPVGQTPHPDSRPWIYSNYWIQYVLDNFSTVEEVIASDSKIRIREYADHYLICERSGKCASIEFLDGKMVYHTGNDLSVKALANSEYKKSLEEWYKFKAQNPRVESSSINSNSLRRFVLAADGISKYKATDPDSAVTYAFKLLDEVSGQKTKGSTTRWSIVFDAENFRIFFRTFINEKIRYIELKDINFSCKTPVKMLDINENIEGNATNKLRVYSTDFHFNHAFPIYKKWGVEYDPESLKRDIHFLENFKCGESSSIIKSQK